MNATYKNIKKLVKTASDKTLKEMYLELDKNIENADIAETLVYTAVTDEMENRNIITFNEETFQYEFIA